MTDGGILTRRTERKIKQMKKIKGSITVCFLVKAPAPSGFRVLDWLDQRDVTALTQEEQ